MKGRKIGTITLALTLIGIGIILLINSFTPLDIMKILRIMSAVSIILIGVEFIFFDWFYKKSDITIQTRISAGSIILLIVIYGSSFLFTNIPIVIENGQGSFWVRDFFEPRNVYEYTKSYTEEAGDVSELILDNTRGDIDIQSGESNQVIIEAVIKVNTYEDEEKASTLADNAIDINKRSDALSISTDNDMFINTNTSITVNYTIQVPKHLELDLTTGYGDVITNNINEKVTITNRHGEVEVNNSGNAVTIENSYGDIDVAGVVGITKIENKHGDVRIQDVEGDLELKNSYEDISLSNISGNVMIKQAHGKIEGRQIGKDLKIIATYSSVKVDEVGGMADIETTHEFIDARNIGSNTKVSNSYGNITLVKISGQIDIYSKHSKIEIDNGNIMVDTVNIDNSYGDITLNIPKDQEGKFDLSTKYGKISTDLDFSIDKENNKQTVKETIGDGKNTITLYTTHGDIRIK